MLEWRYTVGHRAAHLLREAAEGEGAGAEILAAVDRLADFQAAAADLRLLAELAKRAGVELPAEAPLPEEAELLDTAG
jgi:hypothetical protein